MRAPVSLLFAVSLSAYLVVLTPEAFAQQQSSASQTSAVPRAYDATKEVVLNGAISQVISKPNAGLPLGLHLMVSTAQGEVDVHLGPYYARVAAQKGLVAGASIQVTGVRSQFPAGKVFLARVVVVGEQTLTVRSPQGMPVRPVPAGGRAAAGSPAGGL